MPQYCDCLQGIQLGPAGQSGVARQEGMADDEERNSQRMPNSGTPELPVADVMLPEGSLQAAAASQSSLFTCSQLHKLAEQAPTFTFQH